MVVGLLFCFPQVTPNLYGNLVANTAAGIAGGTGVMPGGTFLNTMNFILFFLFLLFYLLVNYFLHILVCNEVN